MSAPGKMTKSAMGMTQKTQIITETNKGTEIKKRFMKAGHLPKNQMNKTEERFFNEILYPALIQKELKSVKFHEIKLKVGEFGWYEIDFFCIKKDDNAIMYEVKGGMITGKGRVKFDAACLLFPLVKLEMWQYKNREWKKVMEN